jgi:hypothetical protein
VDEKPLVVLAWPWWGVGLPAPDLSDADLNAAHAELAAGLRKRIGKGLLRGIAGSLAGRLERNVGHDVLRTSR